MSAESIGRFLNNWGVVLCIVVVIIVVGVRVLSAINEHLQAWQASNQ